MKKAICISIAAAVMCSFTACSNNESTETDISETTTVTSEAAMEESEVETTESPDESSEVEMTTMDFDEDENSEELLYNSGDTLIWYTVENETLTEHSENTVPDILGTGIIEKLVESGMLVDGTKALSFEKATVSDGTAANDNGLYEVYHTEGIVDMSASFTDILNQEEEATQKLYLEAIAESYKKTYGLDIVDIKCNGNPIMTDYINYDNIVEEERQKFAVDADELPEVDECYIEFDE